MGKYQRLVKLRLAWWFLWWGVCALGLALSLLGAIDLFAFSEHASTASIFATAFWLIIFGIIVPNKIPGLEKLIKKDLKKDPDNLNAKVLLLQITLSKHKNDVEKKAEESNLREHIKAMQDELDGLEK